MANSHQTNSYHILELESHLQHLKCNDYVISTFSQQKQLILEIKPRDFLKIF